MTAFYRGVYFPQSNDGYNKGIFRLLLVPLVLGVTLFLFGGWGAERKVIQEERYFLVRIQDRPTLPHKARRGRAPFGVKFTARQQGSREVCPPVPGD